MGISVEMGTTLVVVFGSYLILVLLVLFVRLCYLLVEWCKRPSMQSLQKSLKNPKVLWKPVKATHRIENFRAFMETSKFGQYWLVFQFGCTLLYLVLYVASTYLDSETYDERLVPIAALCLVLFLIFGTDYAIMLLVSEDRLRFVVSLNSFLDIVSLSPVLLPFIHHADYPEERLIRTLMVLRAVRILRFRKLLFFLQSDVQRQLFTLVSHFAGIVFLSAATLNAVQSYLSDLQIPESNGNLGDFHDAIYFVIVSFSTVGYGDIAPNSVPVRVIIMVMIVVFMISLPVQTSKFIDTLKHAAGEHAGSFVEGKKKRFSHFIITGHVSFTGTIAFLRELMNNHFDADDQTRVVILSPEPPNRQFLAILDNPFFKDRVQYLVGSPLVPYDLERAKVAFSKGCFLLANSAVHSENSDTVTSLYAMALKTAQPDAPLLAQVTKSLSQEVALTDVCDRIICINEMKMRLLGRNCIAPGVVTLITNLVRSYPRLELTDDRAQWLNEYAHGCSNQISSMVFPSTLVGSRFVDAVQQVYEQYGVTIFAVHGRMHYMIMVNPPSSYEIQEGDVAFFIADNDRRLALLENLYEREPAVQSGSSAHRSDELLLGPIDQPSQHRGFQTSFSESDGLNAFLQEDQSGPLPQKDRSIEDITTDDASHFVGHVIVCNFNDDLRHFLLPLRGAHLRQKKKVVIVDEEGPTEEQWKSVRQFADLYWIKGIPTKHENLCRAGVRTCSNLVILRKDSNGSSTKDELLADSESVFIYKSAVRIINNSSVVVELTQGSNIDLITVGKSEQRMRADRTRLLFNDYSLPYTARDNLLQKRQQEKEIESQLEERKAMLVGHHSEVSKMGLLKPFATYNFDPLFAAGQIFSSSLLDSLLCQEFFRPFMQQIVLLLIYSEYPGLSQLFQISISEEFVDRTYGELFVSLLQKGMIALGLFRSPFIKGNTLPYVYTNCQRDDKLYENDRVFVLAREQPDDPPPSRASRTSTPKPQFAGTSEKPPRPLHRRPDNISTGKILVSDLLAHTPVMNSFAPSWPTNKEDDQLREATAHEQDVPLTTLASDGGKNPLERRSSFNATRSTDYLLCDVSAEVLHPMPRRHMTNFDPDSLLR